MKTADITRGMTVLYAHGRPTRKHFSLGGAEMAEVLATGVTATYRVTVGGWSDQRTEHRSTGQGIRLRVTRNDRTPRYPDEDRGEDGLRPATYEADVIAAYLLPAEGETLKRWQAARARSAERTRAADAREAAETALAARLTAAGIPAKIFNGVVSLGLDDAGQLLDRIDALEKETP
jgi:hypothetical protein